MSALEKNAGKSTARNTKKESPNLKSIVEGISKIGARMSKVSNEVDSEIAKPTVTKRRT